MALKAGRVGLDPKYVDENGAPIGIGGGTIDAYTKAEADAKFATKSNTYTKTAADNKFATQEALADYVPETQLTANSKEFYFAYDSTTQKYGYKAGAEGAFVPFESAGAPGWNKPADLVSTGLTMGSGITLVDGGYKIDGNNIYFDLTVTSNATIASTATIATLDSTIGNTSSNVILSNNSAATNNKDVYTGNFAYCTFNTSRQIKNTTASVTANNYLHVWGQCDTFVPA